MHHRDKLCSELGLHITGDVFDGRCDGIPGCEGGVHDNTKVFDLEVALYKALKGHPSSK